MPTATLPRRRRNPRMIAGGLLLVLVGAMASAFLYLRTHEQQQVVVAARPLIRGQVLTREHLALADVGEMPTGATVDAAHVDALVGTRAGGDLPAGAFVPRWSTSSASQPPNLVRVGLRVLAGRAPSASLLPGTMVRVISVDKKAEPGPRRIEAKVVSEAVVHADGSLTVDVELTDEHSQTVALWSAHDEVSLIALPG